MKTYVQACKFEAERMYSNWLGGGDPQPEHVLILAYIYDRTSTDTENYITSLYDHYKGV